MNVEALMTRTVTTCSVDESLAVAAQRLWDADCGALPIVSQEGRLLGIITDRDICMAAWFQGRPLGAIRIGEVMSRPVASVRTGVDVEAAERVMADKKVRRIPVVDASDHLLGIIAIADIVREANRPGNKLVRGGLIDTLAAICQPRRPGGRRAA